jgi:TonB family protein
MKGPHEVSMKTVVIAGLLYAFVANAAAAQSDPLQAARDLYASAAYEEAFSEFTRLKSLVTAPGAAAEVDQYRAFCLVALGRTADAEALAESLLRKDPMVTVGGLDASPRIETMFATIRKRVLPQVIRDEYRIARSLVGQKSPEAQSHLAEVQRMLTEAEKIGVWDETLSDLRTLVDGFLELSQAAGDSPPAPFGAVAEAGDTKPSTPPPDTQAVYRSGDEGVVPPVTVAQVAPQMPPALVDLVRRIRRSGIVDVLIDEQGVVKDVTVRQSVNPAYDGLVVAAARTWKYRPATRNGVPVRFLKSVVVNAEPSR